MENTENMELLENGQDEEKMTLEKFEDATEEVKKVTQETKLVFSEYYSSITGNKVYFKPGKYAVYRAYKVQGAYYLKISTLSEEEKKRGLITASAKSCPGCGLCRQAGWNPRCYRNAHNHLFN